MDAVGRLFYWVSCALAAWVVSGCERQEGGARVDRGESVRKVRPVIAVVDMQELFKNRARARKVQQELQAQRAAIEQENNERKARIRELEDSLTKLSGRISEGSFADEGRQVLFAEWDVRQQERVTLERETREFLLSRNEALKERMLLSMKAIFGDLRQLVENRAREGNYQYVFDRSAVGVQWRLPVVDAKDAVDLTPVILRDLNTDLPVEEVSPIESIAAPSPPGRKVVRDRRE